MVDLGFFVANGRGVIREAICHACRVDLLAVVHGEEMRVDTRIRGKGGIVEEGLGHGPSIWRVLRRNELRCMRRECRAWLRKREGVGRHGGRGGGEGDAYAWVAGVGEGREMGGGRREVVEAGSGIVAIKVGVHG